MTLAALQKSLLTATECLELLRSGAVAVLTDIQPEEVSLVDRAANKWKFTVVKGRVGPMGEKNEAKGNEGAVIPLKLTANQKQSGIGCIEPALAAFVDVGKAVAEAEEVEKAFEVPEVFVAKLRSVGAGIEAFNKTFGLIPDSQPTEGESTEKFFPICPDCLLDLDLDDLDDLDDFDDIDPPSMLGTEAADKLKVIGQIITAIAEASGWDIVAGIRDKVLNVAKGLENSEFEDPTPEIVEGAVWSRRFINDLPDSAFLLIEPGGKKDEDGKTTPRRLRHFPVRDQNGNIDLPHLRNAIARIPQAKIPGFTADDKQKLQEKARRMLEEAQKAGDMKKGEEVVNQVSEETVVDKADETSTETQPEASVEDAVEKGVEAAASTDEPAVENPVAEPDVEKAEEPAAPVRDPLVLALVEKLGGGDESKVVDILMNVVTFVQKRSAETQPPMPEKEPGDLGNVGTGPTADQRMVDAEGPMQNVLKSLDTLNRRVKTLEETPEPPASRPEPGRGPGNARRSRRTGRGGSWIA